MVNSIFVVEPNDPYLTFAMHWLERKKELALCAGCAGSDRKRPRPIDVYLDESPSGPVAMLAPHADGIAIHKDLLCIVGESLRSAVLGVCFVKARSSAKRGRGEASMNDYKASASYVTLVMPTADQIRIRGGSRSRYFVCDDCGRQYASFPEPPLYVVRDHLPRHEAWVTHDYDVCVNPAAAKAVARAFGTKCRLEPLSVLDGPIDGREFADEKASRRGHKLPVQAAAYQIAQWNPEGDMEFADERADPKWLAQSTRDGLLCRTCRCVNENARGSARDVVLQSPVRWRGEAIAQVKGAGLTLCRRDIAEFVAKKEKRICLGTVRDSRARKVRDLCSINLQDPVEVVWSGGKLRACKTCGSRRWNPAEGLGMAERSAFEGRSLFVDWSGALYVDGNALRAMDRAGLEEWSYVGVSVSK